MNKNSIIYLSEISGFKIRLKEIHWSNKINIHKLSDDFYSKLNEYEDSVAENIQSTFGLIKIGDITPILPKSTSFDSFLDELLDKTNAYYKSLDGEDNIAIKNVIEGFIEEISTFKYLSTLTLKEGKKNNGRTIKLTENQLKNLIENNINNNEENIIEISGNYVCDGYFIFIDRKNNFISIKDENDKEIYTDQSQSTNNLFTLFERLGSEDIFHQYLKKWIYNIIK